MRRVFLRFLLGYHPAPVSATSKQDQPILLEVKNLKTVGDAVNYISANL